jgi:hypothetical protein
MADLTLRLVKGSPLTNAEVDNNFTSLNVTKIEIGGDISGNITIPLISGLWGRSIGNIEPANGQALIWVSSNNAWEPGNVDAGTIDYIELVNKPAANISLVGDITGSANALLTANSTILDITTVLADTGVAADTYGNATIIPVFTVDSKGRITSASNVGIEAGTVNYADLENKPSLDVSILGYVSGNANVALEANTNSLSIVTTKSNVDFFFTDIPPSSPSVGDRWIHSETGVFYQFIDDGNSTQWVNVTGYASAPSPSGFAETLSPFLLMGA